MPAGLALRQQVQLQPVLGLQVDHQLVRAVGRGVEDGVWRGPEVDHDARVAPRQSLAGADVKRHAGPAPVGDLGAQGHKSFGLALRVHTRLFAVPGHCGATGCAFAVLPAHHIAGQRLRCPGFKGAQNFEFFIADRVGMGVDGRLHADGTQQLQGVVLHHVSQCPGGFIKRATAFHTEVFRDGDLDIGDVLTPPQRLKQGVAKAQRKQVLHRRFAQIVVNPEYLLFFEVAAHGLVDRSVAGQVMAQRLFQYDPDMGGVQAHGGELLADHGEQRRCRGHIHHHGLRTAGIEGLGQGSVIRDLGQVHGNKFEQGCKAGEFFGAGTFGKLDFVKPGLDQGAVLFVAVFVASDADDAPALRQGSMAKGLEQSGHEFAPGQVAGTAKENKIEAHNRTRIESRLHNFLILL